MSGDDQHKVDGAIGGVNFFGALTERLFSRFYRGLNRREDTKNAQQAQQRRRQELEQKIEQAKRVVQHNKKLKQTLQQRSQDVDRLGALLGTLHEGIIMQDMQGSIVYMNTAARELLGNKKNFWGSDLATLFESHQDDDVALDSEIIPLGVPDRIQINNRILGAQMAVVANDKGERLGTMMVLRDVTKDTLADRLKDQFVTALSHELKTPMTVIKGMSEVLSNQPDDKPPNRRLLETLSRNVDILDRMVVELLDVSEMGAGTFDVRQDVINLESLLWRVIRGVEPEAKKKSLDIFVMVRDRGALMITGDEERLRWAIGHILQNSIAYTDIANKGQVRVEVGLDENDPRFIRIDFVDRGVGITPKDAPHIFDRFYRGDPRDHNGKLVDPRGLGQGLYIARIVAEAHGGYLGLLRSDVGKGSIFTMVLPIHDLTQP